MEKQYISIDLKSFYASVEAVERGLNPLDVNLVVADESRTDKTICLAVSPALKALGISGRARLFEVRTALREANSERRIHAPSNSFSGSSVFASELKDNPHLSIDLIIAPPRMSHYMTTSRRIYEIYMRYISPDDILVYSIDEVFIDATPYLKTYDLTTHELAMKMIHEVLAETGITATAGIGTNMYLAKIAMDIEAKHMPADKDGVRIAFLDEYSYREKLWSHRPITDFWRVGAGTAKKLAQYGMYTMGDVARCSNGRDGDIMNEELLYRLFGINAELLIDHAWGFEPAEISDCKSYTPEEHSLSSGQVLKEPYTADKARLVVAEMADGNALDLVRKRIMTDQVVLTVGYDVDNIKKGLGSEIVLDRYGRKVPKPVHGSKNLAHLTSSSGMITQAALSIFDRIVDKDLLIRRLTLALTHLVPEGSVTTEIHANEQLDLFTDYEAVEEERKEQKAALEKERRIQEALISIRDRFGRNAIIKGMSLEEGATAIERNSQIGGHRAGDDQTIERLKNINDRKK